ncbi:MAG: PadR family transcriptional regulator [Dehalococcoidia bacterium]|nr:PadR family transcriptional regulator [Dehalococcoidia bacterium]
MWRKFHLGEGGHPFFGRGDVKFIILDLLKDKPKHGYEIMKDMEAKGSGFYAPSPGSIYPTLQMLEDMGYVASKPDGGKKVYEITDEGRKYLDENRKTVHDIHERFGRRFEHPFKHEVRDLFRELHDMVQTLVHGARDGKLQQSEQLEQVRDVLNRARKEIEDILSK